MFVQIGGQVTKPITFCENDPALKLYCQGVGKEI